ncbi:hypothetical protein F5B21DRAFT_473999 [Xylaria acuta]|nr:hypothetical protein F5B21DRAFT_473999 [Xylaria acuta]
MPDGSLEIPLTSCPSLSQRQEIWDLLKEINEIQDNRFDFFQEIRDQIIKDYKVSRDRSREWRAKVDAVISNLRRSGDEKLADWVIEKLLTKANVYNPAEFELLVPTGVGSETIRIIGDEDQRLETRIAHNQVSVSQHQHVVERESRPHLPPSEGTQVIDADDRQALFPRPAENGELPATRVSSHQYSNGTQSPKAHLPLGGANMEQGKVSEPETEEATEYEIESIQDRRLSKPGSWRHREYLVRWKLFSPDHDEWLPVRGLNDAKELVKAYDKAHPRRERTRPTDRYAGLDIGELRREMQRRGLSVNLKHNCFHLRHGLARHDATQLGSSRDPGSSPQDETAAILLPDTSGGKRPQEEHVVNPTTDTASKKPRQV